MWSKTPTIPTEAEALPGRDARMRVPEAHYVNGHRLEPPFPAGLARLHIPFTTLRRIG